MSSRTAAGTVRAALAEVAKALAHKHRVELIEQLAQGPRSVEALAERAGLSLANASQHLQQLRGVGLVTSRRGGKRVFYRLADEAEGEIVSLLGALRHVAEHAVASMERVVTAYFRTRDELEPVAAKELLTRLRQGDVVILDVRPEDEYGLGHLPGALNIPLRQLEQRIAELPREQQIIAYCRGPYCVLSFEAVAELRTRLQSPAFGTRFPRVEGRRITDRSGSLMARNANSRPCGTASAEAGCNPVKFPFRR